MVVSPEFEVAVEVSAGRGLFVCEIPNSIVNSLVRPSVFARVDPNNLYCSGGGGNFWTLPNQITFWEVEEDKALSFTQLGKGHATGTRRFQKGRVEIAVLGIHLASSVQYREFEPVLMVLKF